MMRFPVIGKRVSSQRAFILVEILLTATLLAVLCLPLWQMLLDSHRTVHQRFDEMVAIVTAQSMLDRLRANHSTAARLREWRLAEEELTALLPRAILRVSCEDNICDVHIQWPESIGEQYFSLRAYVAGEAVSDA